MTQTFDELMRMAAAPGAFDTKFRYQRALVPSQKTRNRQKKEMKTRMEESKRCNLLTSFL